MTSKLLFLFSFFFISNFHSQIWQNIGGNENYNGYFNESGSGYSGYCESIGEYSPKNLPFFYGNSSNFGTSATLSWKVGDEYIYLYDVKDSAIDFWIFSTEIREWKKINTSSALSYGIKGVESPTNFPGTRTGSLTWVDNDGNLWLYGNSYYPKQTDLWKYSPQTSMWTWVSGTQDDSSFLPQQNIATSNGLPKTYDGAFTWVDSQNNLWMFGGSQQISDLSSSNQVWKYDTSTNQWTWKKGNKDTDYIQASPVYGTIDIENASNTPGELYSYKGAIWTSDNYAYMIGADGPPVLWRYNMLTNNWSHIKRPQNSALYNYGVMGEEKNTNFPPNSNNPASWKDNEGNFWIFGGLISDPLSNSVSIGKKAVLNTLWKYNPSTNNWTWMKGKNPLTYVSNVNSSGEMPYSAGYYGIKNVETAENQPHSRYNTIIWGKENNLFFGYGVFNNNAGNGAGVSFSNAFKDIWKYNIDSNNFTWTGGRSSSSIEYFENKNEASVYNKPNVINFVNDNEGNVFAFHRSRESEIWKYNISTQSWVLIKQHQPVNYGNIGVESSENSPMNSKNIWYKDHNIYFTSNDYNGNYYNTPIVSLWKFNTQTNNYTCLKKLPTALISDINVENVNSFPNPVYDAVNWINDDKLYTLGGTSSKYFWEYNLTTNIWKRLTGLSDDKILEHAVYSKDSQNNVWVFGGSRGSDSAGSVTEYNNNVWKFDSNSKTWIELQGAAINQAGYYGTQNISSNQTRPGSRYPYASWMDQYDRLWIYSGRGFAENTNGDYYNRTLLDLWYYDTKLNAWFWVDGYKNSFYPHDKELNFYNNNFLIYNYYWKNSYETYSFVQDNKFYFIGRSGADYNISTNQIWKLDVSKIAPKYSYIEGTSKINLNGGNCSDPNSSFARLKLKATNSDGSYSESISNQNGYYRILLNNVPNTVLTPVLENPSYFNVNPSSVNINFTNSNSVSQDFCITPNGTHKDLEIQFIPIDAARPGFETSYRLIFLNKGNTTLSGNVNLNYPKTKITFVSSEISPDSNINSNLTWNFTNLKPFERNSFIVKFKINPPTHPTDPVNSGDKLIFNSKIFPIQEDETPLDNQMIFTQNVVNSIDPNDKTCLEGDIVTSETVGKEVHYLIRFENTGTASAIRVIVKDVIDTDKFDIETLQTIKTSHPYRMTITEKNKVEYYFENIQLPYSLSVNRYGYILFKIKTKTTLKAGDTFSNKADIYFDYNTPLETNNFTTKIENELATSEKNLQNNIIIFPNPAKDLINFKTSEKIKKIEIFDISGKLLKTQTGVEKNQIQIHDLRSGNYIVKVFTDKNTYNNKFIKN